MKRVLITGKDSYIGTNFKKHLEQYQDEYYVEELDVKDDSWKEHNFTGYDVVFHVAGIAHVKEKKENEGLYYKINRDLAYEVAKKAKDAGISQFIFMSSMSVYGLQHSKVPITRQTMPTPNTYYGRSKLEAERLIQKLESDTFNVCIVRPPMVYGDNAPGNLTKLLNTVRKIGIFPTIKNKRSSITIETLSTCINDYIKQHAKGTFLPQNKEYLCTYEVVREKMNLENKKVIYISVFNPLIKLLIGKIGIVSKCFGDLIIDSNTFYIN